MSVFSNAGVNWNDWGVLGKAGVNWNDFAVLSKTGLNWNDVIANENVAGRNLVYYTFSDGYRATYSKSYNWETDTYYRHTTETNWWYASEAYGGSSRYHGFSEK